MRALEAEMVEEQKARVESLKLLKSLDAQMEEKQKIEQADFKQFLAEKRLIDEVIAKVRDVEECSSLLTNFGYCQNIPDGLQFISIHKSG